MEKLLISACLTGENCKYDGGNNALPPETLAALRGRYELVPVCPEQLGGLPTPRVPSECRGSRVVNRLGEDVTAAFQTGAEEALRICRENGCRTAVLKAKSPSCGKGVIHNGRFDGGLVDGDGVTARLLAEHGIEVLTDKEWLDRQRKR